MKHIMRAAALLVSCLCALTGCADTGAYAVAEAEYPEMASRPSEAIFNEDDGNWDYEAYKAQWRLWQADRSARLDQPEGYTDGLAAFTARAAEVFMTDTPDENRVLSPLNLYLALSMLAETTGGECREQIFAALGVDSPDTVRSRADSLWNANYCDDGALTSVLANSLWLDRDLVYVQDTVDTLADIYHASTYQGQMGDEGYNRAFRQWLNEQTGGLLTEAAEELEFTGDTVMALASTIYYRGKWGFTFQKDNTAARTFHTPAGDVTADFMVQSDDGRFYFAETFTAVSRTIESGGNMWLFLPAEGVTPDQVLTDGAMYRLIGDPASWEGQEHVVIHQYIPKFDVSSTVDLQDGMTAMGITDIWDSSTADFSPMIEGLEGLLYLDQASHSVRVAVDEEGVTAAAFTVLIADAECAPPEKEVDFILDRPFVFVITGTDNVPLFLGKVCTP